MLLIDYNSKFAIIYDALNLTEVSKVNFIAKDTYGNDVSYFSMTTLSFDGSYVLTSDYNNWYIFSNKGELVKTTPFKGHYTIYPFSKTEYLVLQYPEYPNTSLIAFDFIKETERVVYKSTTYLSSLYISDDSTSFILSGYTNFYCGSFKSNEEQELLIESNYNVYKVAFKGSKIGILYSFNNECFVAVYQNGKLLWKDNVKTK